MIGNQSITSRALDVLGFRVLDESLQFPSPGCVGWS